MTRSSKTGKVRARLLAATVASAVAVAGLVSLSGWVSSAMRTSLAVSQARSPRHALPSSAGTVESSGRSWQLAASRHYGGPSDASGYSAVVAPSPKDAWVFGGTNPGAASTPVAEHWAGHSWQAAPLPAGLDSFISGASAAGPSDVWAFSSFGGYALRWNGLHWSVARRWHSGAQATCVSAISPDDVWLFGTPGHGASGIGTWRFDGHRWSQLTGRGTGIYRASAISRNDIWGITPGPRGGDVEQWNGHRWRLVPTEGALNGARLDDVTAVTSRDVWVVGDSPAATELGNVVVAHWDGRSWHRVVVPAQVIPRRVVPDGHGGAWIAAMSLGGQTESRLLHVSRGGAVTQTNIARGLGNAISDLALIPGSRSLWGSGGYLTTSGGDAAIWLHMVTPGRDRDARLRLTVPVTSADTL